MNSSNCQTVSGNLRCRTTVECCQLLIRIMELNYLITVNGLLGIIYEMHTSYHGLEIVEEDGQISIRLPNTLQAMPAKKSLLRIKKILDDNTYQPYPEYQSAKDIQEENQILPDTGVTVAQEKRWVKEQEGLLLRATDLYSPDVNYNQIEADRKALRKQYPDDSEDED